MQIEPESLDLTELSERAGVSARTVRYYIQQGLLPAPEARGPGAHYGAEHLDRLLLIKRLQREHLPLAEIRRQLEALGPQEVRRLAERKADKRDSRRSSASQYIREVLSEGAPMMKALRMAEHDSAASLSRQVAEGGAIPLARSQWDRILLARDVELHVRRPLTREQNRQVERLIEAARNIFEEDTP